MRTKADIFPRISAIAEELEKGISTESILKEFTARWAVAKRTVEWYISLAKPLVAERIKTRQAIIDEVRKESVILAAREQIISDLELEAILCAIAKGEPLKRITVIKDKPKKVNAIPDVYARINAIHALWKKRGTFITDKKTENDKSYIIQYKLSKPSDTEHIENT